MNKGSWSLGGWIQLVEASVLLLVQRDSWGGFSYGLLSLLAGLLGLCLIGSVLSTVYIYLFESLCLISWASWLASLIGTSYWLLS